MSPPDPAAVERACAELRQLCLDARGDREDDLAAAHEAGERTDDWGPPEASVNVVWIEAILTALQASTTREAELRELLGEAVAVLERARYSEKPMAQKIRKRLLNHGGDHVG